MQKPCEACGTHFNFETGEGWKRFCLPCWKKSKTPKPTYSKGNRDTAIDDRIRAANLKIFSLELKLSAAEAELRLHRANACQKPPRTSPLLDSGNLKALRRLCHPDRHNGSETANRLTQLLNREINQTTGA